jgi:hypothetical protein
VIRLSDHGKNKPTAHPSATSRTEFRPLPAAEKYSGQITRELAIEMLEHARRHLLRIPFPDSWSEIDKVFWLESIDTLHEKSASLRPNVREVLLPRRYPDHAISAVREFEYLESAKRAMEVVHEILETAELELGKEFRARMNRAIIKTLRRTDASRLAKPSQKVNLEMIRILDELVHAQSSGKEEPLLKELAPGPDPDRWAHNASINLNRFCERAYNLFQQSDIPLEAIEQIRFVPEARYAFLTECSLKLPRDGKIAREAIRRGEELTYKRSQRRDRRARPVKPFRPK